MLEETVFLPDEDIDLFNNWLYYTELQKMFYEFDKAMEQCRNGAAAIKAERKLKQEASM